MSDHWESFEDALTDLDDILDEPPSDTETLVQDQRDLFEFLFEALNNELDTLRTELTGLDDSISNTVDRHNQALLDERIIKNSDPVIDIIFPNDFNREWAERLFERTPRELYWDPDLGGYKWTPSNIWYGYQDTAERHREALADAYDTAVARSDIDEDEWFPQDYDVTVVKV